MEDKNLQHFVDDKKFQFMENENYSNIPSNSSSSLNYVDINFDIDINKKLHKNKPKLNSKPKIIKTFLDSSTTTLNSLTSLKTPSFDLSNNKNSNIDKTNKYVNISDVDVNENFYRKKDFFEKQLVFNKKEVSNKYEDKYENQLEKQLEIYSLVKTNKQLEKKNTFNEIYSNTSTINSGKSTIKKSANKNIIENKNKLLSQSNLYSKSTENIFNINNTNIKKNKLNKHNQTLEESDFLNNPEYNLNFNKEDTSNLKSFYFGDMSIYNEHVKNDQYNLENNLENNKLLETNKSKNDYNNIQFFNSNTSLNNTDNEIQYTEIDFNKKIKKTNLNKNQDLNKNKGLNKDNNQLYNKNQLDNESKTCETFKKKEEIIGGARPKIRNLNHNYNSQKITTDLLNKTTIKKRIHEQKKLKNIEYSYDIKNTIDEENIDNENFSGKNNEGYIYKENEINDIKPIENKNQLNFKQYNDNKKHLQQSFIKHFPKHDKKETFLTENNSKDYLKNDFLQQKLIKDSLKDVQKDIYINNYEDLNITDYENNISIDSLNLNKSIIENKVKDNNQENNKKDIIKDVGIYSCENSYYSCETNDYDYDNDLIINKKHIIDAKESFFLKFNKDISINILKLENSILPNKLDNINKKIIKNKINSLILNLQNFLKEFNQKSANIFKKLMNNNELLKFKLENLTTIEYLLLQILLNFKKFSDINLFLLSENNLTNEIINLLYIDYYESNLLFCFKLIKYSLIVNYLNIKKLTNIYIAFYNNSKIKMGKIIKIKEYFPEIFENTYKKYKIEIDESNSLNFRDINYLLKISKIINIDSEYFKKYLYSNERQKNNEIFNFKKSNICNKEKKINIIGSSMLNLQKLISDDKLLFHNKKEKNKKNKEKEEKERDIDYDEKYKDENLSTEKNKQSKLINIKNKLSKFKFMNKFNKK